MIFLLLFVLVSCASPDRALDVTKHYKYDMGIHTKDLDGNGILVLPKKSSYNITFNSPGKLDLFTFNTCSREIAIENARSGFDTKEVQLTFVPNEIEQLTACPVEVNGFAENGVNSFGYIDFEDSETTLPARMVCGEKTVQTNGVSICQGRVDLLQKISFDVEVHVSPDDGCKVMETTWGKEFIYSIPIGKCVFDFVEVEKPNRVHRLTTIGYDTLLLRK